MKQAFMRRGLTYVEVLVLIGIVALVISIILPLLNRAKERSGRMRCPSNLRQIGQGLMLYAADHKGAYPRVRHVPGSPLTQFTGAAATQPFAENGPSPNDVTAAIFLLIRYCDMTPGVFICPGNQKPDKLDGTIASQRSNFTGPTNYGYSFANLYPDEAAVKMGYTLDSKTVADFVIGADRNECRNRRAALDWRTAITSQIKEMNALNHDGEGQNVLFNDGHVEWCTSPFVGAHNDHIYTQQDDKGLSTGSVGNGQPRAQYDTVLLPYWDNGQPKPRP